ncbi:Prolyl endopeptidase [Spatholobus suberectus]|nr:Prolyl endopeptidase [Spatholobus suberectus]
MIYMLDRIADELLGSYVTGNAWLTHMMALVTDLNILFVQKTFECLDSSESHSEDGTISLNMLSMSKDDKFLAYGLSSNGSD